VLLAKTLLQLPDDDGREDEDDLCESLFQQKLFVTNDVMQLWGLHHLKSSLEYVLHSSYDLLHL
jgi:hypothetical protein